MPKGSELDTLPIIHTLWQSGKHCYLPVADPVRKGLMYFALYQPKDPLIKNQFGILEPAPNARRIPNWALQLVIMPLVAFDTQGNRIGSGCGYYDRVFAHKTNWPHTPILCGVAYDCQQVDPFSPEPWDVPMDYIITETADIII